MDLPATPRLRALVLGATPHPRALDVGLTVKSYHESVITIQKLPLLFPYDLCRFLGEIRSIYAL